mmetsp:Transcript_44617/g.103157  ORF Transcript_44617/g.103157 Transcript_44617/m.103157 type:complete len:295 (+) Transcript_44617:77-961(+)
MLVSGTDFFFATPWHQHPRLPQDLGPDNTCTTKKMSDPVLAKHPDLPSRREHLASSIAATDLGSSLDSSSEASSSQFKGLSSDAVVWDDIKFARHIQPYRQHAHSADDIHLLSCFLELAQLPDVEGDAVKLLLRVLRFLRLCDYSVEDICSILAHASAYFVDTYLLCGNQMDANEVGNVLATLVFVAHCYVQDETCPLHVWHRHLFRKYCPLKTLNAAVVRLLEIRRYKLRLDSEDLSWRFKCLLQAAQRRRAAPLLDCDTTSPEKVPQSPEAGPELLSCTAGFRKLSLGKGGR